MGLIKIELIKQIEDLILKGELDFFPSCDLSLYSTMRLKSCGDLFLVRSVETLKDLLRLFIAFDQDYFVLGLGANVLLPENSTLAYIQIKLPFDKSYLDSPKEEYSLPASVTLSILSSHAVKFSLSGWESFTGIPATLGGAIFMNAGTKLGEIGALINEVTIITKEGTEKIIKIQKSDFSYRKNSFCEIGDIIVNVKMRHLGIDKETSRKIKDYLTLRNNTQPLKAFTCGCVFKNNGNCLAGKMIDGLGLKGLSIGNIKVSPKHANFMENTGGGTRSDVLKLIKVIQLEVLINFGIKLEIEAITSI